MSITCSSFFRFFSVPVFRDAIIIIIIIFAIIIIIIIIIIFVLIIITPWSCSTSSSSSSSLSSSHKSSLSVIDYNDYSMRGNGVLTHPRQQTSMFTILLLWLVMMMMMMMMVMRRRIKLKIITSMFNIICQFCWLGWWCGCKNKYFFYYLHFFIGFFLFKGIWA